MSAVPTYVVSAFRRTLEKNVVSAIFAISAVKQQMAKVVAVIGASSNRSKFGNRAVRAFQQQGYSVVPINPHETEIEGLKSYRSVLDVPGTIEMASFYVPPEIGLVVIDEVARKGIPEVWLNPGAESD